MDDDDDIPTLSLAASNALKEFYAEQALLKAAVAEDTSSQPLRVDEDWQLSQFWYDDETATTLAQECLQTVSPGGSVACLSCPTLHSKLRALAPASLTVTCFEYDRRFAALGDDFVFFDYRDPAGLGGNLERAYDLVVADPPFLAPECLRGFVAAMRFLGKERMLLCTGETMGPLAEELLGARLCTYVPRHKNNLANEFRCYANYPTAVLDH